MSGLTSVPGAETPDALELRKRRIENQMEQTYASLILNDQQKQLQWLILITLSVIARVFTVFPLSFWRVFVNTATLGPLRFICFTLCLNGGLPFHHPNLTRFLYMQILFNVASSSHSIASSLKRMLLLGLVSWVLHRYPWGALASDWFIQSL